tara:strand:+ start:1889 stop:2035 length:147 start_codon:yes stop_codon:yes gene_type:complete
MDEGLMAFMDADPNDRATNPAGDADVFKAWKRNGRPCITSDLTQIDKS